MLKENILQCGKINLKRGNMKTLIFATILACSGCTISMIVTDKLGPGNDVVDSEPDMDLDGELEATIPLP